MNALYPSWQAPKNVHALMTTRIGGFSCPPFDSFNLGSNVDDNPISVLQNRERLVSEFELPQSPIYLTQIHSTRVLTLPYFGEELCADSLYTGEPNQVCLVMTADCLPVLLTSKYGDEVAAAHAGWRGLCNGILEATVDKFQCRRQELMVWFGAAIGHKAFQVGQDVLEQFVEKDPNAIQAFMPDAQNKDKYFANIYQLAQQRLNALGVEQIYGGEHCTYFEKEHFFSFRRDGKTGRMASLIWFE